MGKDRAADFWNCRPVIISTGNNDSGRRRRREDVYCDFLEKRWFLYGADAGLRVFLRGRDYVYAAAISVPVPVWRWTFRTLCVARNRTCGTGLPALLRCRQWMRIGNGWAEFCRKCGVRSGMCGETERCAVWADSVYPVPMCDADRGTGTASDHQSDRRSVFCAVSDGISALDDRGPFRYDGFGIHAGRIAHLRQSCRCTDQ